MKKFLISALLIASSFGFANAQAKPKKESKKATTTASVVKKKETKTNKKTVATAHLKADGTADKRFKENKTVAKSAGPLKKDGTPDKRYKANKKK